MCYVPARKLVRRLSIEHLERREVLSVTFLEHIIPTVSGSFASTVVFPSDLDGDGDLDVLSAGIGGKTLWHENTDGKGTFGEQNLIERGKGLHVLEASVYAADVDGDGDLDALLSSFTLPGYRVAWYENVDGKATFGPENVLTTTGGDWLYAADMDGDGDNDVVTKSGWYQNTDGLGAFDDGRAGGGFPADVDGDGDLDAVTGTGWYENTDGQGSLGPLLLIPMFDGQLVYAADVDGDSDIDVIPASWWTDSIAWYENIDGLGTFGLPPRGIGTKTGGYRSVSAADMDGDGDMDVLSSSSADDGIAWYENTDGRGTFGPQKAISKEGNGARSVYPADVDGDGDIDVVSASWSGLAWYEQLQLSPGDANGDLQFNQLDIVEVLQSDNYLTGEPAAWGEGDWTGDGLFDQEDIVAALQTGNYLQGPYAAGAVDAMFSQPER